MNTQLLFALAALLGLVCFITVFLARSWPTKRRYLVLAVGNFLVIVAAYLDPWWHVGDIGIRHDIVLLLAVNAILFARIRNDQRAEAQQAGTPAPPRTEPPVVVRIALALTIMFTAWSFVHAQNHVRTFMLGTLLAVLVVALYMQRKKGRPTNANLVGLAWCVMLAAFLLRFGRSPWFTSMLEQHGFL